MEKKLFALFKDNGGLELPDEDWVLEVMPELNNLENDTLDALLYQAEQHARCVPATILSKLCRPPSAHCPKSPLWQV